jgi:hypothetical protein
MPVSISGTNGVTFPDSSLQSAAASPNVLKNRIINGAMVVNQRATSVTSDAYTVDRFKYGATQASKATVAQSSTAPTGFANSLGVTSSSSYSILSTDLFAIFQYIEGNNFYDLAWGTASAKTVTLSFQVYSSLTGTFGGAILNYAGTRSNTFSYSIPTANTWTQISVTIAGDTGGTWVGATNAGAAIISFGLGVGATYSGATGSWTGNQSYTATGAVSVVSTNGATWYVTGVQLEVGSTATPFERRLYNQELANCYRYYWQDPAAAIDAYGTAGMSVVKQIYFPVTMRISPSTITQPGAIITSGNTANTTFTFDTGTSGINQVNAIISASTAARTYLYRLVQFSSEL